MAVLLLRTPGALAYRDMAVRFVAAACKLARDGARLADHDFDFSVLSAFGEAFNNVALHAYARDGGDLDVEIDIEPDRLVIRLVDRGDGFDLAAVPAPDLAALPESGLGVFIMESCMDEVDYRRGPPNVLRMIKRFHGSSQR